MRDFNSYIIEKLHLDKDLKVDSHKYVIIYLDRLYEFDSKVIKDTLKEISDYIQKFPTMMKNHYIFECPENLMDEFCNKWKRYNKGIHPNELKEWIKKNGIREITADEINKEISK